MRESVRQRARYAVLFYSPSGRYRIAESFCCRKPRYLPRDLLWEIRVRYGIVAFLAGEGILFGWCISFALLLDLYSARFPVVCGIMGFLCCAGAFGLYREEPCRAILKYAYLVCTLFCGGPCLVAAGFLLPFEHIPLY